MAKLLDIKVCLDKSPPLGKVDSLKCKTKYFPI